MNPVSSRVSVAAMALLSLLFGACAAQRNEPVEPPRCMTTETLVCYGRTASKLDTRLNDVDFCRCERVVDGL